MSRPLWLDEREVVGVPDDAVTIYPGDDTRVAIVAWPEWRAVVVTADGGVIEVSEEIEKGLLRDYFGA